MNNEKTIDVLNDLVQINNDRIAGYRKAIDETKDMHTDLKLMFEKYILDSKSYRVSLSEMVKQFGGEVARDTTVSGKIYRAWMDTKNMFAGGDKTSILESCEFGEDAAQKAYQEALTTSDVDSKALNLIAEQKSSLKEAHDTVKKYRDANRSLKS